MRNSRAITAGAFVILTLTACGSDNSDRHDRDGSVSITGIDGRVTVVRPGGDPNLAYSQGLDLKTQGNCPAAVVKLRSVANLGPGYENAQTALGSCLLDMAGKDKDLSAEYLEGLTWLRRAGDAGWPEAQGLLATAHAFGPTGIRNGEEAAYWLVLYETNPTKSRVGFMPMAGADVAAVEKSLMPGQKEVGNARASQWQRKVWLPPVQAQSGPGMGEGGPRGRGRRPQ